MVQTSGEATTTTTSTLVFAEAAAAAALLCCARARTFIRLTTKKVAFLRRRTFCLKLWFVHCRDRRIAFDGQTIIAD